MPAKRNATKPYSRAHRGRVGARVPLIALPQEGCSLPVPAMPAGRDWTPHEADRWAELWKSPQACQWDETARGTVACLIAYESAVLDGTASAWQAQECRYAAEALGLTPKAMTALGWTIVNRGDAVGDQQLAALAAQETQKLSALERARRRRLVVDEPELSSASIGRN